MTNVISEIQQFVFGQSISHIDPMATHANTIQIKNYKPKKNQSSLKNRAINLGEEPQDSKIKKVDHF